MTTDTLNTVRVMVTAEMLDEEAKAAQIVADYEYVPDVITVTDETCPKCGSPLIKLRENSSVRGCLECGTTYEASEAMPEWMIDEGNDFADLKATEQAEIHDGVSSPAWFASIEPIEP